MKKVIIILLSLIVIVTLPILDSLSSDSGLIIEWNIILIEIVCLIVLAIIIGASVFIRYNSFLKRFKNKDFSYIIQKRNAFKLLNNNDLLKSNFHYLVAVSFFETDDINGMIEYLNRINNKNLNLNKYFYMAIYSYIERKSEDFENYYDLLKKENGSTSKESCLRILELLNQKQNSAEPFSDEDLSFIESVSSEKIKAMLKT